MIGRWNFARIAVPRMVPRSFLYPGGIVGLPVTNDYSISVPKVSRFGFPLSENSENHVDISNLVAAQKANDVRQFCKVLNKLTATDRMPLVFQDVLLLLTPEWISKLNASETANLMTILSTHGMNSLKPEYLQVFSLLITRFESFHSVPMRELQCFLHGLSKYYFSIKLDANIPSVSGILSKFSASTASILQTSEFLGTIQQFGITWSDLEESLQKELEISIRNGVESVDISGAGIVLLALGRMRYQLDHRDRLIKSVLSIARRILAPSMSNDSSLPVAKDVCNVIHGLGLMKYNCSVYGSLQPMIMHALTLHLPNMLSSECALMLNTLGSMEVRWRDLSQETSKVVLSSLSKVLNVSEAPATVVDALSGITALNMTKRDLPLELQDKLQSCLGAVMKKMSSSQVAVVANCLGKLGVEWKYLNRAIQETIMSGMTQEFGRKKPVDVAQNVMSLSRIGLTYKQCTNILQSVLDESLVACISKMDGADFATTLFHLGKFKMTWQQCTTHLNITILHSLASQTLQIGEVPRIVFGLSSMGLRWKALQPSVQSVLLSATQKALDVDRLSSVAHPETELSWIVQALADMKAEWTTLPSPVQSAVYKAIESCTVLNNSSLCNVLTALANLQLTWSLLPSSTSNALLKCLNSPRGFDQQVEYYVSSSIWALGNLKCDWNAIPLDVLQSALVNSVGEGSLNSTTVSRVMWSLGKMGASWDMVSESLRNKVKDCVNKGPDTFNMMGLTSTMYALAILSFDSVCHTNRDLTLWSIHYELVKAFAKLLAEDSISSTEQSQAQIYFELLRTVPLGKEMLDRVLPELSTRLSTINKQNQGPLSNKMSSLHSGVAQSAKMQLKGRSEQFRTVNEFSGLESGEMPVDITVYCGPKLVALVEFDGEQHYSASGELLRSGQLKEYLYSAIYPEVPLFRIKNSMIQDKGFQKTGSALTLAILMALDDAKAK